MRCIMRHLFNAIIIVAIAFWAESSMAAIHLVLPNPSAGTLLQVDSLVNLDCLSVVKTGPGAYLVNANLTNSGDTIIYGGILAFHGGTINLQNVIGGEYVSMGLNQRTPANQSNADLEGSKSTLFVANGTVLNAVSITVDSLIIGDNTDTLPPPGLTVPEPSTIIIWSLLGALAATIGWRRRRRGG